MKDLTSGVLIGLATVVSASILVLGVARMEYRSGEQVVGPSTLVEAQPQLPAWYVRTLLGAPAAL